MRPLEGSSWVGGLGTIYQWCYCRSNYVLVGVLTLVLIMMISLWIYFGGTIK